MSWLIPFKTADAQHAEEQRWIDALRLDLGPSWEFKVLHAAWQAFGNCDILEEALVEEAAAGWELALKLDDCRLILRRPIRARRSDPLLGDAYDPYRVTYGTGFQVALGLISGLLLLLLIVAILVAAGG